MHTSCASIQPLCASLWRAYSRWMGPSELSSSAPCRRATAAAASLAEWKSTKATGPDAPLPPVSSRSRENPPQLRPAHSHVSARVPLQHSAVTLTRRPAVCGASLREWRRYEMFPVRLSSLMAVVVFVSAYTSNIQNFANKFEKRVLRLR